MRYLFLMVVGALIFSLFLVSPTLASCPKDSVEVGPICVDKYEVSAWETTDKKQSTRTRRARSNQPTT